MDAADRARRVRLMGFDVDGVLTDGLLYYGAGGDELKAFSTRDGHGLKLLQAAGIEVAIVTARASRALELRAENLGIRHLCQSSHDKRMALAGIAGEIGIGLDEAGYMGDDVVDLPVLRACAFAATVPDGHPLVKRHVHYVAAAPAGRGAVREVCEFILAVQGRLDPLMERYLA